MDGSNPGVTGRSSVTSNNQNHGTEIIGTEKPIIADAFLKNVSKEQLYRFYPNADKEWLDSEHDRVNIPESTETTNAPA